MKKLPFIVSFLLSCCMLGQAEAQVKRIEPLNWWVGMQNPKVQLLVYAPAIAEAVPSISKAGFTLLGYHKGDSPNYLVLDCEVAPNAEAGKYSIVFKKGDKTVASYDYELLARNPQQVKAQGVNSSDFIYLLMPDRFANGNPANDVVKGMRETDLQRDSMYYRHGGDLEGVIKNLDYLEDLGVTALWMTPVLTNDMPKASYHGYANTENYHIDPRFGSNETYKALGAALHQRNMKLVHDVVPNHVGLYHWTVVDKPFKDWLHEWPSFTQTTYKDQTIFDPYAAQDDKDKMRNGWFVETMPDLNQSNPFVANYITQSHIWWIEFAGVDGFRIDTYPYNDLTFMANWTAQIQKEYPSFTFFGETWVHSVPNQAFFLGGQQLGQAVDSKLEGVTDFQLLYGIESALNKKAEWTEGVNKLYNTLAADYQYPHPEKNVIFLDNHDKDRFLSVVGEDINKYKSAYTWLLTMRGIPQMYYGAELLMKNFSNPDGLLREDFKGGFAGDERSLFQPSGRTAAEEDMFQHVRTLANYRKEHAVLQNGKLMQYVPQDGIYVYFRYNEEETVLVALNGNDEAKSLDLARFQERNGHAKGYRNILTGESLKATEPLRLAPRETLVLEIIK